MSNVNELCDFVRETAFAIHRYHRHGHLEKVYENALAHRYLRSARKEHGLLMNFGAYTFQIRKYAMSHESLDP
jgi:hypothetical protein